MFKKVTISLLLVILFSSCVSLDRYDEWQSGNYETEKAELERFEEIKSEYKNIINFDSSSEIEFIFEKSEKGYIRNGIYSFEHKANTEFSNFRIDIEKLKEISNGNLKKVAILIKTINQGNGFVEVWPGDDLVGGNPNSVNNRGVTEGSWSMIEFIIEGNSTKVIGKGFEKTLPKSLAILNIFCMHGSKVELDYILFE